MSNPHIKPLTGTAKHRRIVYLLTCLAEEAGEVAKEASKVLRFGLDNAWNGSTPRQRLGTELMDMSVIDEELLKLGVDLLPTDEKVRDDYDIAKRARLEAAYKDSRKNGLIRPD